MDKQQTLRLKRFRKLPLLLVLLAFTSIAITSAALAETGLNVSAFVEKASATIWSLPNITNAEEVGTVFRGTQVEILENWSDVWCYIKIGSRTQGYILKTALSDDRIPLGKNGVMQKIGYLVSNQKADGEEAVPGYQMPSTSSVVIIPGGGVSSDVTTVLYGDLGSWYQVSGSHTDVDMGFERAEYWDKYLLTDLFPQENTKQLCKGNYRVGIDIPVGLYTFVPSVGKTGSFRYIRDDDNRPLNIETSGPYTLFLSKPGDLSIESEGTLYPITAMRRDTEELAGSGLFFVGWDLAERYTYTITPLDPTKPAWYRISSLNKDPDEDQERWYIQSGQQKEFSARPGVFLEIENCKIELVPSLG